MTLLEKLEKVGATPDVCERLWNYWKKEWHHRNGEFGEIWYGYETLRDETLIPIFILKGIMKVFRDSGIAYHAPTFCDYEPHGSGNFIHEKFQDKTWDELKEMI